MSLSGNVASYVKLTRVPFRVAMKIGNRDRQKGDPQLQQPHDDAIEIWKS
jgi:hypothetical protein